MASNKFFKFAPFGNLNNLIKSVKILQQFAKTYSILVTATAQLASKRTVMILFVCLTSKNSPANSRDTSKEIIEVVEVKTKDTIYLVKVNSTLHYTLTNFKNADLKVNSLENIVFNEDEE